MSMRELGIEYKKIEPMLVAYFRFNLKERSEIPDTVQGTGCRSSRRN